MNDVVFDMLYFTTGHLKNGKIYSTSYIDMIFKQEFHTLKKSYFIWCPG